MNKEDLNKGEITLIKSLIIDEMRKLESALDSSMDKIHQVDDKEYFAKHIEKLNTKLNKLDTLLKKISK